MSHIVRPNKVLVGTSAGLHNVPVYEFYPDQPNAGPEEGQYGLHHQFPRISSVARSPYIRIKPLEDPIEFEGRYLPVAEMLDLLSEHHFYPLGWMVPRSLVGALIDLTVLKRQADLIPEDEYVRNDREFLHRLAWRDKVKRQRGL